jgi:hypothetical protein
VIVRDRRDVDDVIAQHMDEVAGQAAHGEASHDEVTRQPRHCCATAGPGSRLLDRTVERRGELQTQPDAPFVAPVGSRLEFGGRHRREASSSSSPTAQPIGDAFAG